MLKDSKDMELQLQYSKDMELQLQKVKIGLRF